MFLKHNNNLICKKRLEVPRLCLLIVSILLMCPCIWGQNLSVEEFIPATFDLSSRTSSVTDNNGIPCALLKIICTDEITDVQGNVMKVEDHGNEYWVYLTTATKRIKILTNLHVPLDININAYFPEGLVANSTYQLNLKSDLPPDILFGMANPLAPTAMCKQGEPLLPKWWNIHEDGMYVGVSPASTFDGDIAKRTAITNAIFSFVHSKGCLCEYTAETETKGNSNINEHRVKYYACKEGFSIKIVQEYYNPEGSYFVLCALDNDSTSSSSIMINWEFEDNNLTGTIQTKASVKAKINRYPFENKLDYVLSWTPDSKAILLSSNGKKLFNDETKLPNNDNIADFLLDGDLGISQLRLLTTIPLLPGSVSYSSTFWADDTNETFKLNLYGTGESGCHDIKFYNYSDGKLKFGVSEEFPKISWKNGSNNELFSQKTGLSFKYNRQYIDDKGRKTALVNDCVFEGELLEVVKNVSLLTLLNSLSIELKHITGYREGNRVVKTKQNIEVSSDYTPTVNIYPQYYLDPDERRPYSDKKYRKSWMESKSKLGNATNVIMAIDPTIYE